MANDRSVKWQPDILGVITGPIHSGAGRRPGILIDDEGALHIDLHGARVYDRAVDFRRVRAHAKVPGAEACRGRIGAALILLLGGVVSALRRFRSHHERGDVGV